MYCRWAKNIIPTGTTENVRVEFPDNTVFTEDTPNLIITYLRKRLNINQGRLEFPIITSVVKVPIAACNVSYTNILTIRSCIEGLPQYFSLTRSDNEANLLIQVSQSGILMNLSDMAFSQMDITFKDLDVIHFNGLKIHLLIALSRALFCVGKIDLGNDVIFDNSLLPIILKTPLFVVDILPYLLSGKYFVKTMVGLNTFFQKREDDNLLQIITNVLLLERKDHLNEQELSLVDEFLFGELKVAQSREDPLFIGISMYNLGNHYRSRGNYQLALKYYLDARKYHIAYKLHGYYCFEIAGLLFELGRFQYSNWFYRKAIELGTEYSLAKALLADSLIYCGKYRAAIEVLNQYLKEQTDIRFVDEWSLKFSIFSTLLANEYPEEQKRNSKTADYWNKRKNYEKAIDFDLLSPLAWFNIGVKNGQSENSYHAFNAFTLAALLYKNDVESWVNATLLAMNEEIDKILFLHVVRCAHFYNGQNFILGLSKKLQEQVPQELEHVLGLVDKIILDKPRQEMTIRYLNPEGNYVILNKENLV